MVSFMHAASRHIIFVTSRTLSARMQDDKDIVWFTLSSFNLCTCHRLAPGVGPRANQGDMSGNTRRWIGFSAPGEGKLRNIVFKFEEKGVGEFEIL